VIVRPAQQDDVPWLVATSLAAYQQDFARLLPECEWSAFDAVHFTERFNRQLPAIRVVISDVERAGFSLITGGHIDMFFVDGTHRGSGIGHALLRDAVAQGARTLECFVANEGARRFYARHGWREGKTSSRRFAGVKCSFIRMVV
jgi:GNAT superfamily N-acetyltransferase